jgi:hypothetical protein
VTYAEKEKPYFRLDPVPDHGTLWALVVIVDEDPTEITRFESSWTGAAIRDALNLLARPQRAAVARRLFPGSAA